MKRTTLAAAVLAVAFLLSLSSPADAQSQTPLYILQNAGTIRSVNLDGTSLANVTTSPSSAQGIAVSHDKIFWVESNAIKSVALDGTGLATVVSGLSSARAVAVHGDKLYWLEAGAVKTSALDGTSISTVVSDTDLSSYTYGAITVTDDKVYYSMSKNRVAPKLKSVDLDGSSLTTLYTGSSGLSQGAWHVSAIQVSGTRIYGALVRSTQYNNNRSNLSVLSWNMSGGDQQTLSISMTDGTVGAYFPSDSVGLALSHDSNVLYAGGPFGSIIEFSLATNASTTLVSNSGLQGQYLALLSESSIPILKVAGTTDSTALLDWDDIEDATDYQYRHKLSSEASWGAEVTTTESNALLTGLLASTSYDFQARSRESGTANDWSATLTVTTMARPLVVTRWPDRVGDLVVVSEGAGGAQLQWQHQINARSFDIGLWQAGQMDDLSARNVSATVSVPEVWEQISSSLGVWSAAVYPEFDADNPYIGAHNEDPNKVILLNHYRYTGDILYYWNTALGIWRVLRCASPSNGGCDYGTPSSTDTRTLQTISSNNLFTWFNLDEGPADWGGVYRNEDEALEAAVTVGAVVIFLDPLNYARFTRLNPTLPSATVSDLPEGRQYLAVRGVTNDGRKGAWSYLTAVGTEQTPDTPQQGEATVTDDLIYTDELIVSQHYIYDEDTLLIQWPSLVGARHYDIRFRGTDVQRIAAAGGAGQEVGLDVSDVSDTGIEYELRGVVMAGTLSYDIIGADGTVLYIVPPGRTAYSRWSATRVALITEDGTVAPGSQALLLPQEPTDRSAGIVKELLRATQLEDDAGDDEVGRWMLPIGVLGSIMMGGLVGFGAGKGRFDKSAVVAGGMVFVLCLGVLALRWLGLSPVEVAVIFIVVLVVGLLIALYQYFR